MKTEWRTPKLICLARGRPEEAVLEMCKGTAEPGASGVGAVFQGCYHVLGEDRCECCHLLAIS